MSRLAPKPVNIDERERKKLEKIVARHSTSQQVVKRGKIVLLASEGNNHRTIARELGISREMARLWRERCIELQRKDIPVRQRLLDGERPGSPTKFSTEQVLKLFALACESPEKYGRPISHWTSRELAQEMIKQGIVKSISRRQVGRLLSEASLKPHLSEYWLNPPPTKSLKKKSIRSVCYISKQ